MLVRTSTNMEKSEPATREVNNEQKQQRPFCRLSQLYNDEHNTTASVRLNINGDHVSLEYPIIKKKITRSSDETWSMRTLRRTKKFLGLEDADDPDVNNDRETMWRVRRIRMANR